ncbi:MAG: branched-chain amino acid ABC transporter permease [Ardenticatenaceae bacterium]|nr:branched-chain amino acid ABC transporter permease [Anaerolineales bacterium]MCB8937827.1 branched-chain amino acid ABC transporter permease [Ardenticatenaceae bacterium]MCB8974396.1 branched-chain amino acid ABC transporter permease [Ardenticatenaceae bacterium]
MAVLRPAGDFDRSYEQDMAVLRKRWQYVVLIAFLLLLFALPYVASESVVSLVNRICIFMIAVQGLNILTGYTGQISLGQAAFMTVGGYISALLVGQAGWSFFLALPVAGLGAGLVGLLFGLPSLRVKGFYLVMATLSAQFIIPWFTRNLWPDVLNGAQGINVPVPVIQIPVINNICYLGTTFNAETAACLYRFATPTQFIHITLIVLIISTIAAHNISRSRLGRAFISIRDNDLAAELLGINLFSYKLRAFFIASVYAGVAGALLAHNLRHLNSETIGLNDSVIMLGMLIVGGLGTSVGPIFGTTLIILLEEMATLLTPTIINMFPGNAGGIGAALRPFIFGLALTLFLIFEPRGLAYRWRLIKAAWRLRPFAR